VADEYRSLSLFFFTLLNSFFFGEKVTTFFGIEGIILFWKYAFQPRKLVFCRGGKERFRFSNGDQEMPSTVQ